MVFYLHFRFSRNRATNWRKQSAIINKSNPKYKMKFQKLYTTVFPSLDRLLLIKNFTNKQTTIIKFTNAQRVNNDFTVYLTNWWYQTRYIHNMLGNKILVSKKQLHDPKNRQNVITAVNDSIWGYIPPIPKSEMRKWRVK